MQVIGGICYAHGPYEGQNCPRFVEWQRQSIESGTYLECPCVADTQMPEFIAMAKKQMVQPNDDYQRGWRDGRDAAARVIQMVMSCPEDCGCSLNLSHAKILALTPPTEQPEPTTQPGLGARSGVTHQGEP